MRLSGRLGFRKAAQLAESILNYAEGLKQGQTIFKSVPPEGQTAGVGHWDGGSEITVICLIHSWRGSFPSHGHWDPQIRGGGVHSLL